MTTANKYFVATVVFLSLSLAVSQHTVYVQGRTIGDLSATIEVYKRVVELQQSTIAVQDNALTYVRQKIKEINRNLAALKEGK